MGWKRLLATAAAACESYDVRIVVSEVTNPCRRL